MSNKKLVSFTINEEGFGYNFVEYLKKTHGIKFCQFIKCIVTDKKLVDKICNEKVPLTQEFRFKDYLRKNGVEVTTRKRSIAKNSPKTYVAKDKTKTYVVKDEKKKPRSVAKKSKKVKTITISKKKNEIKASSKEE